jgi:heme/copper-type cytochrome/quinol oxidase subunit 2
VWTLIPAVGLAVVLVFTWRAVEAHGQAKAIQPVQSSVVVEHPS